MPKIIKNGKEYSGVPIEVVTAWAPTADPVQVKEPLMGNTDISTIGDGTVTGAIDEINTRLTNKVIVKSFDKTTTTGAFFIEANELPTGVTTSSHWFIAQPMYGSTALLGWAIALQINGDRLACYIRQGTTLPADGSRIVFNLFCIKK